MNDDGTPHCIIQDLPEFQATTLSLSLINRIYTADLIIFKDPFPAEL
jgi:hypothetical protein